VMCLALPCEIESGVSKCSSSSIYEN
jgi:hypothetical protein